MRKPKYLRTVGRGRPREIISTFPTFAGGNTLNLYRVNEDGSQKRRIQFDETNNYQQPTWSPDGTKVVAVQQANGYSLVLMTPDGLNQTILVNGFTGANVGSNAQINQRPVFTPDSQSVTWFSLSSVQTVANAICYIINVNTKVSRPLFTNTTVLAFGNLMPVVSCRNEVAFASTTGANSVQRLYKSALNGDGAVAISAGPATDPTTGFAIEQKVPNWSADGQYIAHWEGVETAYLGSNAVLNAQIANTWNIWVVDRNGNNKRVVGHGDEPNWSPDGYATRVHNLPGYLVYDIERTGLPMECFPTGLEAGASFSWNPMSGGLARQ